MKNVKANAAKCLVSGLVAGLAALAATPSATWAAPIGFSVSDTTNQLYRIDLATGLASSLGLLNYPENDELEGLASVAGNLLAVGESDGIAGGVYNITTPPGQLIGQRSERFGNEAGAAVDPRNGILYNIGADDTALGIRSVLYQTSYVTGLSTEIARSSFYADGLAINRRGEAFATDFRITDALYRVDLTTGAFSLVGSLGLGDVNFDSGLAFDENDNLYALREDGLIYTLNTTTGAASFQAFVTDATTGARIQGDLEGLDIPELTRNTPAIPEPGTLALLLPIAAAAGLAIVRRRRAA